MNLEKMITYEDPSGSILKPEIVNEKRAVGNWYRKNKFHGETKLLYIENINFVKIEMMNIGEYWLEGIGFRWVDYLIKTCKEESANGVVVHAFGPAISIAKKFGKSTADKSFLADHGNFYKNLKDD
jgi:hypothetical protein